MYISTSKYVISTRRINMCYFSDYFSLGAHANHQLIRAGFPAGINVYREFC